MDFKKASKEQLRAYAEAELGLVFAPEEDKAAMLQAIQREIGAIPELNIDRSLQSPARPDDGLVRVLVHRQDDEMGDEAVPVTVNNYTWLVKRGVEAAVPRCVYEVLKNAVRTVYRQVTLPDGSLKMEAREVQAYPFSLLGQA